MTADMLPWLGQPYSVKRHGASIQNCDSEPVQTPGCIQDHGALLVLRLSDLIVIQVSENVEAVLGHRPEELLNQPVTAAVGLDGARWIRDFLAGELTERNPLFVFTLPARDRSEPLDVSIHTVDGVALVEFEATGRGGESDYFGMIKRAVSWLQSADTLSGICRATTEKVRQLTGFDRVMVYRFHEDHSGEVFAESRREGLGSWLGLHYPPEDIPKPARDIFTKIWIRPVANVSGGLAELVPLVNPETGRPLDMTYCALRGPSIMYTEYLQNMGVAAALTMPILRGGELWGLIACHHYSVPKPIPYAMRAACELLAQIVSLHHRSAEDRENLLYGLKLEEVNQQLVAHAVQEEDLAAIFAGKPALLDGLEAEGAALYHRDKWWRVGATPSEGQLNDLAAWLSGRPEFDSTTRPVYATDSLGRDYPAGGEFAEVASGVLGISFSRSKRSLLLWFRPELVQTVTWAGNPNEKPTLPGPNGPRLTPRVSFEIWKESVRGRSLPWKPIELDAALHFRLLVMEMVISRAEHLADLNAELSRSNEELDAFAYVASHDLKEPLRGIHKYAHQLIEKGNALGDIGRNQLEAITRLTLRMDSLLDSLLIFARVGRAEMILEETKLDALLSDAIEMVSSRADDERTKFITPRPLPVLRCDWVRCREIFVNLLSNALKYNDKPEKRIEIGYIHPDEKHERPGCPEGSEAHVILYVRDNGIGIHPRHAEQVFKMFKRLHARDAFGGGSGAGLTIVKKLVERHRGRVWFDSIPDQGTTFYFTLPCEEAT